MRPRAYFVLIGFALVGGCSQLVPTKEGSTVKPQSEAQRQVDDAYTGLTDASEFLMDTKHTLRGLDLPGGSELLTKLLNAGAVTVKVDGIEPSADDPQFKSARQLVIETPISDAQRKVLFDFLAKISNPPTDTGQKHVVIDVPPPGTL